MKKKKNHKLHCNLMTESKSIFYQTKQHKDFKHHNEQRSSRHTAWNQRYSFENKIRIRKTPTATDSFGCKSNDAKRI